MVFLFKFEIQIILSPLDLTVLSILCKISMSKTQLFLVRKEISPLHFETTTYTCIQNYFHSSGYFDFCFIKTT